MKKSFLNLRKLGLVLVAAGSMAMYSCGGGEESHDETTENVEEVETVEANEEDHTDEMQCGEGKCGDGMEDSTHACGEGKCGDGAEEASCGEGKCGEGHDAEGAHAEGEHKCEEGM